MDLELFRNYIEIVETGSLTAAASRIHIAQPTLSKQLRQLELYFDAKLIITERGSRRVLITDAGRLLYDKAKYICSLNETAKEEIERIEHGASGTLRLSVANSRCKALVEGMLKPFSALYPHINYSIHEASYHEQRQALLSGLGEIGFLSTPPEDSNEIEELFRKDESLVAVFNANSEWLHEPQRKGIHLLDLKDIPISISRGCYTEFRKSCAQAGFTPLIRSVNTTKSTALYWAEADAAVTIVPTTDDEHLGAAFCVKKIVDIEFDIYKSVVRVKDRPLSYVALKFVEFYNENSNSHRLCNIRQLFDEVKRTR